MTVTQEELDMAMQDLAEARRRNTNARAELYEAIEKYGLLKWLEHAELPWLNVAGLAIELARMPERIRDLEEQLRISTWDVDAAETRVRNLEAKLSRYA